MADNTAHFYEPHQGHGLRHDPFNAIVAPRPIGWISSVDKNGLANLAPYSFFNGFNYTPPIIGFSSIGWKDSVANVAATGEFCWNLATKALAREMNLTCAPAPPDIDEFEVAGLTKAPSRFVSAPRILESPVNFECKLTQIIRMTDVDGVELKTWIVLGQVVAIYIDKACITDGVYETPTARPILRAGRLGDYVEVAPEAMFEMRRPNWPIDV
jgi:flavin reductase (DIM6/NTAB) family NADH-FMN oxidoreductase RutF